jgi:hypothetical protein
MRDRILGRAIGLGQEPGKCKAAVRRVGGHAEDRDAAALAVGDHERAHIRGDAGQSGLLAGASYGNLAAAIEVDDAHRVRSTVGHVGAMSGDVDVNEIGKSMQGDGCNHAICVRIDNGDGTILGGSAGIDDVYLVAAGIYPKPGGPGFDLQRAILAKVD